MTDHPTAPVLLHPSWGPEATEIFNRMMEAAADARRIKARACPTLDLPAAVAQRLHDGAHRTHVLDLYVSWVEISPTDLMRVLNDSIEAGEIDGGGDAP